MLTDAIAKLYQVFQSYPFRPDMPRYFPDSLEQSEIDSLGTKALQTLTAEDLSSFTRSLLLDTGEIVDLKHFLPRILELISSHQFDWMDEELVLGKLADAEVVSWEEHEKQVVNEFLSAWWWLEVSSRPETVQTSFAALCSTGLPISPYLQTWRSLETEVAVVSLSEFIVKNYTQIVLDKKFNGWVQNSVLPELREFFTDPQTREHLERMYFVYGHEKISWAEQLLH